VETRLTVYEARIVALEGIVGDLRADMRVAAERDRHLREVLGTLQATLERSR
jgi:hypothetical protein